MKAVIFLAVMMVCLYAPWLDRNNTVPAKIKSIDACLNIEETNWVPFGRYVNTNLGCEPDPRRDITFEPEDYEREYFVSFLKTAHELHFK
jgi:hypothetical protein